MPPRQGRGRHPVAQACSFFYKNIVPNVGILPKRFVRIRHYGLLTNRGKITRLNQIRENMGLEPVKTIVEVPVAIRMLEKFGYRSM